MSLHELRAKRATTFDAYKALGEKPDFKKDVDQPEFVRLRAELDRADAEIKRYQEVMDAERKSALPVGGQDTEAHRVYAAVKHDVYTSKAAAEERGFVTHKGMVLGGAIRMLAAGRDNIQLAATLAARNYGESHPVTKALVTNIGGSGGYLMPPDQATEIIEVLRPLTAVRAANPRTMPMPRGTMTMPAQTSAATATYSGEAQRITPSQQGFGQVIASYKKMTALVPGSNDLLRYTEPAADAIIRDDLVKVIALREDLAFLIGDGTANAPRGFLSFANQYAAQTGGSAGTFLSGQNSTYAVGGNFITSNETYTQSTVANELAGAINRLDTALVPNNRRVWFFHPRIYNYLYNLLNSLGLYVYRDEMTQGKLLGCPIANRTTQIPANIWDTNGANTIATFVFLVEMTEAMILDSMQLELFVSREGTYTDSTGTVQSLVQNDEFLIRAIVEHDFQMRHPAAVSVIQGALWAPAIS